MGVSAVHKGLITMYETPLDSEVEYAGCKAKSRVASIMAVLLTALILQTLLTGYEEEVMKEDVESNEDEVQADVV